MAPIGPEGPIGPPGPIGPRQATIRFTVAYGTFTETGEATVFQVQQAETHGSFTETGEAAALTPGIVSAYGSFAETGEAALFQVDMVEAYGSVAETGEAALFEPGIVAAFGSFVLTGEDAITFEQQDLTDTANDLQLPINCIMGEKQLYRDRWRETEGMFKPLRTVVSVTASQAKLIKGGRPSFTTTTSNRGY
jgi:hypothetical protein